MLSHLKGNGLGKPYWTEVIDILRNIIPVYDKVNSVISLGKDNDFRKEGIVKGVYPHNFVLDAGSGYGNMSKAMVEHVSKDITVVYYDPIFEMLKNIKSNVPDDKKPLSYSICSGVFERIPFKNDTFDAVVCGYSLRDAIVLDKAIEEIYRVLKKNGRFVIVDLGKPDNTIARFFVSIYLKYFLAILAFIVAGRRGIPFKALYGTFMRWPTNSNLKKILLKNFSKVEFSKKFFGGAIVVISFK
jgi:demethylmenaquinone methyltransferase/2-methoxy-6-polyprenyl-1,4-benzoquinol methylase